VGSSPGRIKSKIVSIQRCWEESKLIKTKLNESHQNCISQLLEVDEAGERKTSVVGKTFWQ
jgi:hypothetical protein